MTQSTYQLSVPGIGAVDLTVDERGEGRPLLLLHGGAGPLSVANLADALAAQGGLRVLTPTHPGFEGTPRPAALDNVPGLAAVYEALLERIGLTDVVVAGNSLGGWI